MSLIAGLSVIGRGVAPVWLIAAIIGVGSSRAQLMSGTPGETRTNPSI